MKTGAPAFGTPDYMRTTQMTGQMARFYGLPLRASNTCVSNAPDNQATWESSHSLFAAITSGANMVYHAAGWLEGGLCASYEKFIMDCEQIQQLITYMQAGEMGCRMRSLSMRLREVGQGGHFFGIQHTQDRYEKGVLCSLPFGLVEFRELARPRLGADRERANKLWKKILEEFEPPPMDAAIRRGTGGIC